MRRIALALCAGGVLAAAAVVPSSHAGCGCWSSAFSPIWKPDGSSLLYTLSTSSDGQSLQEAPVTRTKPTLVRGGISGGYVAFGVWSPDASRLAFWRYGRTDASTGIWVADGDGANARLVSASVAAALERDEQLSWLPDGHRLVFAAADGSVRLVDVVSGEQIRLATGTRPLASPDGRSVAFQRDGALWLVGADGGGERRLTTPAKGQLDQVGSWSPDSRRLAFSRQVANPGATYPSGAHAWNVVVANVATGATTTLADDGNEPAWSPDGSRIAYAAEGIAVVPAGGGERQLLTDHFYRDSSPAWSPDGRTIAFSGPDVNGAELFLVGSEGGDLHNLTGYCPVTPVEPFGYLCSQYGLSVPVASATPSFELRVYSRRGLTKLWTSECRCFDLNVVVRDAIVRVRGSHVRARLAPGSLLRAHEAPVATGLYGTATIVLAATPRLRRLHPKKIAVRIDALDANGKVAASEIVQLPLPAP